MLRDALNRAVCHAAQLHGALGDQVGRLARGVSHLVEQFVKLHELRPLHVPVRLLGVQGQIDAVRQPRVQDRDHHPARRHREVILGVMRQSCFFRHTPCAPREVARDARRGIRTDGIIYV